MFETLLTADAIMGYLVFAAVLLFPVCVIFKRAGFSYVLGLLVLVPYTGLFLCLGYLGLKKWPNAPKVSKPKKKKAA